MSSDYKRDKKKKHFYKMKLDTQGRFYCIIFHIKANE